MPSSTRLDKETEEFLNRAAQRSAVTKSEIVRIALREYCKKVIENKVTSWEIYFSVHEPGGSNYGKRVSDGKKTLKKKSEAGRKKWSL
ncbi:MAG: CopG family transcriptional regulator [bacterium]